MSTMQLFFIAPSPLVKIILPEWEKRLEKNPELLFDDKTPFEFNVETGTRTFRIKFNTPTPIIFADPKWVASKEDVASDKVTHLKVAPIKRETAIYVRDSRDLESTWKFLTGEGGGMLARQTDPFGIVAFDPENAIVNNFEEMSFVDELLSADPQVASAAREKMITARLESAKRHKAVYAELVEKADERIRRSLRSKHNNLIAQWQRNEENKLGRYAPSIAERCGFKVLEKEINQRDKDSAAAVEIGNEMMNKKYMG